VTHKHLRAIDYQWHRPFRVEQDVDFLAVRNPWCNQLIPDELSGCPTGDFLDVTETGILAHECRIHVHEYELMSRFLTQHMFQEVIGVIHHPSTMLFKMTKYYPYLQDRFLLLLCFDDESATGTSAAG
jgi:hypothetical protein